MGNNEWSFCILYPRIFPSLLFPPPAPGLNVKSKIWKGTGLNLMTYKFKTQKTGVHQAEIKKKSNVFLCTCRKARTCISDICRRRMDYVSKYFVPLLQGENRNNNQSILDLFLEVPLLKLGWVKYFNWSWIMICIFQWPCQVDSPRLRWWVFN